ncbi:hypothetical protein HK101_008240 [Irineochytrium annulatum]|nr:hypothetical protein HK101_008240 [Irineochytrium annulatum]
MGEGWGFSCQAGMLHVPTEVLQAIGLHLQHPHEIRKFEAAFAQPSTDGLAPSSPIANDLTGDPFFADAALRLHLDRRLQLFQICPVADLDLEPARANALLELNLYRLGPAFIAAALRLARIQEPRLLFKESPRSLSLTTRTPPPLPRPRPDPQPVVAALYILRDRDLTAFMGLGREWIILADDADLLTSWLKGGEGGVDIPIRTDGLLELCIAQGSSACVRALLALGLKPTMGGVVAAARAGDLTTYLELVRRYPSQNPVGLARNSMYAAARAGQAQLMAEVLASGLFDGWDVRPLDGAAGQAEVVEAVLADRRRRDIEPTGDLLALATGGDGAKVLQLVINELGSLRTRKVKSTVVAATMRRAIAEGDVEVVKLLASTWPESLDGVQPAVAAMALQLTAETEHTTKIGRLQAFDLLLRGPGMPKAVAADASVCAYSTFFVDGIRHLQKLGLMDVNAMIDRGVERWRGADAEGLRMFISLLATLLANGAPISPPVAEKLMIDARTLSANLLKEADGQRERNAFLNRVVGMLEGSGADPEFVRAYVMDADWITARARVDPATFPHEPCARVWQYHLGRAVEEGRADVVQALLETSRAEADEVNLMRGTAWPEIFSLLFERLETTFAREWFFETSADLISTARPGSLEVLLICGRMGTYEPVMWDPLFKCAVGSREATALLLRYGCGVCGNM